MTKAQVTPEDSESWLSPGRWDRVDSRNGPGGYHVTKAGVALHSSTAAQLSRQLVTPLCASPGTRERRRPGVILWHRQEPSLRKGQAVSRTGAACHGPLCPIPSVSPHLHLPGLNAHPVENCAGEIGQPA